MAATLCIIVDEDLPSKPDSTIHEMMIIVNVIIKTKSVRLAGLQQGEASKFM